MLKQASVRIEEEQLEVFRQTATELGTTTTEALRLLIYAFNRHGGFPYNMSMNLDSVPPRFREKLSDEEVLRRIRQAKASVESGKSHTHDEVFSRVYGIIEKAQASR